MSTQESGSKLKSTSSARLNTKYMNKNVCFSKHLAGLKPWNHKKTWRGFLCFCQDEANDWLTNFFSEFSSERQRLSRPVIILFGSTFNCESESWQFKKREGGNVNGQEIGVIKKGRISVWLKCIGHRREDCPAKQFPTILLFKIKGGLYQSLQQ